ncbi:hypothetical protein SDC9_126156 [bioreactor metagenome]|uniref:Uncharacterized protein n=1 Tax=bioreactor metagenome TaxID=1076179 RepID=A0A645CQE7_9ZZZZ
MGIHGPKGGPCRRGFRAHGGGGVGAGYGDVVAVRLGGVPRSYPGVGDFGEGMPREMGKQVLHLLLVRLVVDSLAPWIGQDGHGIIGSRRTFRSVQDVPQLLGVGRPGDGSVRHGSSRRRGPCGL